jgi:hypothetical protein
LAKRRYLWKPAPPVTTTGKPPSLRWASGRFATKSKTKWSFVRGVAAGAAAAATRAWVGLAAAAATACVGVAAAEPEGVAPGLAVASWASPHPRAQKRAVRAFQEAVEPVRRRTNDIGLLLGVRGCVKTHIDARICPIDSPPSTSNAQTHAMPVGSIEQTDDAHRYGQ